MSIPKGVALMLELEADVRRNLPPKPIEKPKVENLPLSQADIYELFVDMGLYPIAHIFTDYCFQHGYEVRKK